MSAVRIALLTAPFRPVDPEVALGQLLPGHPASFGPPAHKGVAVRRLSSSGAIVVVETDRGTLTADHVIAATGGYQVPVVDSVLPHLPAQVPQNVR